MTPAERIQNLGFRTLLLFGIFLGAGYYFTMFDDGNLITQQMTGLRTQINKMDAELVEARKMAANQAQFQGEVDRVASQLKLALELLPTTAKVTDVLDKMSKEATSANVRLRGFVPRPAENKGFYDELRVDVVLEGTFPNLILFLSDISSRRIHRIITLRNLELQQKTDTSSNLTIHGTLVAYRYTEAK